MLAVFSPGEELFIIKNALSKFHNGEIFPPLATAKRVIFFALHHENLVEFLEIKPRKVWKPPKKCDLQVFSPLTLVLPLSSNLSKFLFVFLLFNDSSSSCSKDYFASYAPESCAPPYLLVLSHYFLDRPKTTQ